MDGTCLIVLQHHIAVGQRHVDGISAFSRNHHSEAHLTAAAWTIVNRILHILGIQGINLRHGLHAQELVGIDTRIILFSLTIVEYHTGLISHIAVRNLQVHEESVLIDSPSATGLGSRLLFLGCLSIGRTVTCTECHIVVFCRLLNEEGLKRVEVILVVTRHNGCIGILVRIPDSDRSVEVSRHIVETIIAQVRIADEVPAGILRFR